MFWVTLQHNLSHVRYTATMNECCDQSRVFVSLGGLLGRDAPSTVIGVVSSTVIRARDLEDHRDPEHMLNPTYRGYVFPSPTICNVDSCTISEWNGQKHLSTIPYTAFKFDFNAHPPHRTLLIPKGRSTLPVNSPGCLTLDDLWLLSFVLHKLAWNISLQDCHLLIICKTACSQTGHNHSLHT